MTKSRVIFLVFIFIVPVFIVSCSRGKKEKSSAKINIDLQEFDKVIEIYPDLSELLSKQSTSGDEIQNLLLEYDVKVPITKVLYYYDAITEIKDAIIKGSAKEKKRVRKKYGEDAFMMVEENLEYLIGE